MYALVIFLLLIPSILFAGPLEDYTIKSAESYLYVREQKNKNDGPIIDYFNKTAGSYRYGPYCAAAVYTWYNEASNRLEIKNPLPKTASTLQLLNKALANPTKYKFIRTDKVIKKQDRYIGGDVILWKTGANSGHTGLIISQPDWKNILTIEANTTGSNILEEQREQTSKSKNVGGVYRKQRPISLNSKFYMLGAVRIR